MRTLKQWRSHRGSVKGAECPPLDSEKFAKDWEKRTKSGKRGKYREKRKNWEGSFTLPLLTDRAGYATTSKIILSVELVINTV